MHNELIIGIIIGIILAGSIIGGFIYYILKDKKEG
jgi:hypothetical protein